MALSRSLVRTALKPAILLVALALLLPTLGFAADPINQSRFGGVAIEGYDPVAYFADGKPTQGSKQFTHDWEGATWRFASAENRDRFRDDPAAFAPQYGGYCAYAVSQGSLAGIDPDAWAIVDGKLYLNYSKKIQKRWEANRDRFIADADTNWPGVLD